MSAEVTWVGECQDASELTLVSVVVDEPAGGVVPATLCPRLEFYVQLLLLFLSFEVFCQFVVLPGKKR